MDTASNRFALEANLQASSINALDGHLGDLIDGLKIGLVGDSTATIEGLAVKVSVNGAPVIGAWQAAHSGSGYTVFSPDIQTPSDGLGGVTLEFANLTGGPAPSGTVFGGPTTHPRPIGSPANPGPGPGTAPSCHYNPHKPGACEQTGSGQAYPRPIGSPANSGPGPGTAPSCHYNPHKPRACEQTGSGTQQPTGQGTRSPGRSTGPTSLSAAPPATSVHGEPSLTG